MTTLDIVSWQKTGVASTEKAWHVAQLLVRVPADGLQIVMIRPRKSALNNFESEFFG